jgi:hypothetical protein
MRSLMRRFRRWTRFDAIDRVERPAGIGSPPLYRLDEERPPYPFTPRRAVAPMRGCIGVDGVPRAAGRGCERWRCGRWKRVCWRLDAIVVRLVSIDRGRDRERTHTRALRQARTRRERPRRRSNAIGRQSRRVRLCSVFVVVVGAMVVDPRRRLNAGDVREPMRRRIAPRRRFVQDAGGP